MKYHSPPAGKGPRRDPAKEAFWRKTLAELAASEQTARSFCRQRKLSEPALYAWRRRGEGHVRRRRKQLANAPTFIPVMMQPDDAGQIVIDLRGGRTLKFPAAMPPERLAAIIRAIETTEVRA